MRTSGSPAELEHRRCLALQRIQDGYSCEEVADFLGVDPRSVRRWVAAFRLRGPAALAARPPSGRPPKLTAAQEKVVGRWLAGNPTEYGFATELWTGPRSSWQRSVTCSSPSRASARTICSRDLSASILKTSLRRDSVPSGTVSGATAEGGAERAPRVRGGATDCELTRGPPADLAAPSRR